MSSSLSKAEVNYLRTLNLILRVAPPAVRAKFDIEFHPDQLQRELRKHQTKVLARLKQNGNITQAQWKLLFPSKGMCSSSNFDLTLMICLIRNLTKIAIGDILPHSNDASLGADLSRIKFYRNRLAHLEEGILTDKEFQKYWTDITEVIVRLGGVEYHQKCLDLKVNKLDNNDKEILLELRNNIRSNDPIPVGLKGIHNEILQNWISLEDKIVEIKAMVKVQELIKKEDIVGVIGTSGCGKSTTIHHVALQLWSIGYEIIPADLPGEITQYFNPEVKQVFVFDDICGKFSVQSSVVENWNASEQKIKQILDKKQIKILFSCRKYVYNSRFFQNLKTIKPSNVIDLNMPDNSLTHDEMIHIANNYLDKNEVEVLNQTLLTVKYDCFPLLCQLYASEKKENVDMTEFFTYPDKVISDDLTSIMNESDQTMFVTFVLLVIYNNCIDEKVLSTKSNLCHVLHQISELFILKNFLNIKSVETQLKSMINSYVVKICEKYSTVHDKLFDIMVALIGKMFFDTILTMSVFDLILDRFRLCCFDDNDNKYTVKVPVDRETDYLNRLCQGIIDGFATKVFSNSQFEEQIFCSKFFVCLKRNKDCVEKISSLSNNKNSPLLTVAKYNFHCAAQELIDLNCNVNVRDESNATPLYIACANRHIEMVNVMLKNNADINVNLTMPSPSVDDNSPPVDDKEIFLNFFKSIVMCIHSFPLLSAVDNGYTQIVQLLLKAGAEPNVKDEDFDSSALFVAAEKGFFEIVKLLLEHGAKPNKRGKIIEFDDDEDCYNFNYSKSRATPLYIAVVKQHLDIIDILLKYNADNSKGLDANNCDDMERTPLHIAVCSGRADIVRLLLKHRVNPNVKDNHKITPLFDASARGFSEIATLLLEYTANANICNDPEGCYYKNVIWEEDDFYYDLETHYDSYGYSSKVSPLFVACSEGNLDIARMLLFHGANPNIGELKPLCSASYKGYTEIVKLLLNHGANSNVSNFKDQTAIFNASERGNVDVVNILLQHNADPNRYDYDQKTPLRVAVEKRHTEVVKTLLHHGADPNICDKNGRYPLGIAYSWNEFKITKYLLIHNADPKLCVGIPDKLTHLNLKDYTNNDSDSDC